MKIIRLTTLLDFGGQERKYISFVQDGKNVLKNQYIFAALGYGGYAERYIKEQGFEVKIFNSKPSISNLKNIWMLYKWFKLIKPDLVHTAAAEANFHGIIAAKLANVKVILAEEIGFPNHSKKAKLVFKIIYRFANKVVCVSEAVKKNLIEIGEINPNKGMVIYNPANVNEIKPQKKPADPFTIVCVGRLEVVKNQQLLINCLTKIKEQNTRLVIVGDGKERNFLEALISKLNLNNRVKITGFTNTPEHYLAQAHLLYSPRYQKVLALQLSKQCCLGCLVCVRM